jgi:hypothetical protein
MAGHCELNVFTLNLKFLTLMYQSVVRLSLNFVHHPSFLKPLHLIYVCHLFRAHGAIHQSGPTTIRLS